MIESLESFLLQIINGNKDVKVNQTEIRQFQSGEKHEKRRRIEVEVSAPVKGRPGSARGVL
jgi:hypothetical protein